MAPDLHSPRPCTPEWASAYEPIARIKINYQGIGSSGGKAQLTAMTVDFGGTDAPMTDADIAAAKGGSVVQLPTVIGAVAIAYNLPSVTKQLQARRAGPRRHLPRQDHEME